MAAPLPAPTAAPVIVPQAVITIATNDNPTITAKARNAAVVDCLCMVFMCDTPPLFHVCSCDRYTSLGGKIYASPLYFWVDALSHVEIFSDYPFDVSRFSVDLIPP